MAPGALSEIRVSLVSDKAEAVRLVGLTDALLVPAHNLSQAVSWPHRLVDWQFALSLGQGVAAVEGEDLAGTAMWWPYGADFATLGMVIVAPQRQGRGLGGRLMQAVLAQAGTRSVGLHATPAGLPLYEKLGFAAVGEIHQHQGSVSGTPSATAPVRSIGDDDWREIEALDRAVCGLDRRPLLAGLRPLARANVLLREGRVAGFSMLRDFGRGQSIGPVVAPDLDGAKALIGDWLAQSMGRFLRIDIPAGCGLADWLAGQGLVPVDKAVAMVRGTPPVRRRQTRLFALVSQALG